MSQHASRPAPPRPAQCSTPDVPPGDSQPAWDDEPSALRVWLNQAPSWLTSMVVHMVLLLVLALVTLKDDPGDAAANFVLQPAEPETELEELDEPLEDLLTEPQLDVAFTTTDVVDPVEVTDVSDAIADPGEADELMAAAPRIEFNPTLVATTATAETEPLNGSGKSGYGQRSLEHRRAVTANPIGRKGEAAVEAALAWLAKMQRADGSWNYKDIGASPDAGSYDTPIGATGLALLPFLGAGYTHDEGRYQEVVAKGLKYIVGHMGVKDNRGRLYEADGAAHAHMYSHGIAAMALCEAYGMAETGELMAPAQLAVNYIEHAQHPKSGGWLYTPRQGGDTSVVGWQIMALKSGHMSYLKVDPEVVNKAGEWLDFVAFNSNSAYGYRKPEDRPADGATTAIGLLMRMYLGTPHDDPALTMGVEALSKAGPSKKDMYYNYYATQVMRHYEGPAWQRWNNQMRGFLIQKQEKQGHQAGSWYFAGDHGSKPGGRLYITCMATMTLEVYYRHLPIYQKKSFANKFGG